MARLWTCVTTLDGNFVTVALLAQLFSAPTVAVSATRGSSSVRRQRAGRRIHVGAAVRSTRAADALPIEVPVSGVTASQALVVSVPNEQSKERHGSLSDCCP